jgi:hypothetical protein
MERRKKAPPDFTGAASVSVTPEGLARIDAGLRLKRCRENLAAEICLTILLRKGGGRSGSNTGWVSSPGVLRFSKE